MTRMFLPVTLLAALIAPVAVAAHEAEGPTPPAQISGMDGLRYEGQIGGLQAWSLPSTDAMFFLAPDGRTLVTGFAFTPDGRDLGAFVTGRTSVSLFGDILAGQADLEMRLATNSDLPADTRTGATPAPGVVLLPPPVSDAGAQAGTADLSAAPDESPIEMAEGAFADLQGVFSIPEQEALLTELIFGLGEAQTPEEYQEALSGWVAGVAQLAEARINASAGAAGSAAPILPTEGPGPVEEPLHRDVEVAEAPRDAAPVPLAISEPVPEEDIFETVLSDFEQNGFWFSVGQPGAPVVYAVIDPECPFCARAMREIQPEVEAGELQLRVLLVPVVQDSSQGRVAAILTATDQPVADVFWDHEITKANRGRSDLQLADVEAVPPALWNGVSANVDLIIEHGIRSVPFFFWRTEAGTQASEGAPGSAARFAGALPDPREVTRPAGAD